MESLLQDITALLIRFGPLIIFLVTATETALFVGLLIPAEATATFRELLALDPEAWHTIRVVSDDDEVTVSLGGVRVFQERARADQTPTPGRAGLIATGASEVWFDDLAIEPARRRR